MTSGRRTPGQRSRRRPGNASEQSERQALKQDKRAPHSSTAHQRAELAGALLPGTRASQAGADLASQAGQDAAAERSEGASFPRRRGGRFTRTQACAGDSVIFWIVKILAKEKHRTEWKVQTVTLGQR